MSGRWGSPIGREPTLTGRAPRGLRSLSDEARVVARMVYEENRPRAEVARELGLTLSCVRNMLQKYRDHVRDQELVAGMR